MKTSTRHSLARLPLLPLALAAACLAALFLASVPAGAQTVTIFHSFGDGSVPNDGHFPMRLTQGTDGNFYGTTQGGGYQDPILNVTFLAGQGGGVVYKMTPAGNFTVLHEFRSGVVGDGILPYAGLCEGADGNFYGTTMYGGANDLDTNNSNGLVGCGTIYKITPAGVESPLYSFEKPYRDDAGLTLGNDGNFYGTIYSGWTDDNGGPIGTSTDTFKCTPSGVLSWLGTNFPEQRMLLGPDGNFYYIGTTADPLSTNSNTSGAFMMTPSGNATMVCDLESTEIGVGNMTDSCLIQGTDGNFYGTSWNDGGLMFRLTPTGTLTILHNYTAGIVPNDGVGPCGLIQGADGNFYGTTSFGGTTVAEDPQGTGYGTIFEMTPSGQVTILHNFHDGSVPNEGYYPGASLIQGTDGNLYGTTLQGGVAGVGTIFKLILGLDLFASSKDDQVALSWSAAPDATSYNIYRATSSGAETLYATGVIGTSYLDTSITDGTTYFYEVTSVSSAGESARSNEAGAVTAPPAPTNLVATAGNAQVGLSWNASLGAVTYNVYRGAASGSETLYKTGVTGTSYTDTSVTNGATYYYEVTAVNPGGESGPSNEASVTPQPPPPPPPAPTNLMATAGNAQVDLSWTGSAGATSYNVYRSTTSGTETLYESGVAGTSYTDSNVTNGTTYYYEVTAVGTGGESGKSNEASATPEPPPPPAPLNLIASAGNAQVSLFWTASPGATSYNLYRSTSSGTETLLQPGLTTRSCIDPGVTNGTTYYYEVTAVGAGGEGSRSNEASATPEPSAVSAPTNLVATAGNAQVGLSWTGSTGATSYNVYRSTSSGSETLYHAGVAGTSYSDTGLTDGTTYYYEVTAVNAGGQSAKSNEANATPVSPPPAPLLTASAGNAQVALNWTASAGATSYNVCRSTKGGAEVLYQAGVTGTTYIDTGVTNGVTYFYKVNAGNAGGYSAFSNEAFATPKAPTLPATPTGLKAVGGNAQVYLTWNASAGAQIYSMYRSTLPGKEAVFPSGMIIEGTSFTDTGLTNGGRYFYKVQAVNAAGASGLSNEASAVPHPPAPAAPTLTATGGVKEISLSWTASAGATAYRVYRARISGGEALLIGGITTAGYVDKSATVGVTFYYKVSAVNAYGASPLSSEVSAVAAN